MPSNPIVFWLNIQLILHEIKKNESGRLKVDNKAKKRKKHQDATFQAHTSHQAIANSFPRQDQNCSPIAHIMLQVYSYAATVLPPCYTTARLLFETIYRSLPGQPAFILNNIATTDLYPVLHV